MEDMISLALARVRWKLYKLFMLLSLGRLGGRGPDRDLIYSIAESRTDPKVLSHLNCMHRMSEAHLERFDYLPNVPECFVRVKAVQERNLYALKKVALSAETGAIWIPGRCVFVESLGSTIHFYAWGGFVDVMRSATPLADNSIVVACANLGYFHWLLDVMGQVLIAERETRGEMKLLVSNKSHRFINEGLAFFGFDESRIIRIGRPALVDRTLLVSRNSDLGLFYRENIACLRASILQRVRIPERSTRLIYVSRRHERSRAILNEDRLEDVVRAYGFEICYFEKMPFSLQMQTIAEAKVVMGVHGAGLANIIAGTNDLRVVELINPTWVNPCFAQLACQLGFEYRSLTMCREQDGVFAPLQEVAHLLQGMLSGMEA